MTNLSYFDSFEKPPALHIDLTTNHGKISERNFYLPRQHDLPEPNKLSRYSLPDSKNQVKYKNQVKSTKSTIKEFSYKSQRNCKFMFDSASRDLSTAICLTYPLELRDGLDGRQIKKHFKAFIMAYLRKFGLKGRYIWVLEFQKNRNPHFHLVTDCKVDINIQREFVAARWFKIVDSKLEKHLNAGTSCEVVRSQTGVAAYMASYLQKADQKQVPENFVNVGRFWGGSRNAFEVFKAVHHFEDSMPGIADARRFVRSFRRYKSSKLRELSRITGKRYKLPKPGGGFTCWGGRAAFEQILKWQNKESGVPF